MHKTKVQTLPESLWWTRRQLLHRLGLAGITGVGLPLAIAAPDAQALLSASDAIRNPGQPFRVTVTLTEFEKGTQVNTTTLISYARTLEVGGQFASIMRFSLPVRDAGKVMFKNGSDLWFFDPGTKATVRISPQQRLIGQASNGDVVTVNFARDYQASVAAEETIQDGERKSRASFKLQLTPNNQDATYGSIELWIDAESHAPLKGRFFADSGRLLKTAYYRRFQNQLGALRPTETVIIDGLEPQSVTLVRLTDYAFRNAPVTWFQRDYLPRFNAE
jgi:outer membrane lipoprotein-sorting protein